MANNEEATMKKLSIKLTALAFVAAFLLPISASAYVLGPTTPGKWGNPTMGTGATVTWSLMGDGVDCTNESAGCSITSFATMFGGLGDWQTEVQNAFDAWSSVANINFVQVADAGEAFNSSTQLSGDIRLGGHAMDGAGGTLAHGFFPPVNSYSAAGDIHFDTAETWKIGFGGTGFDIFSVLAHELGHAIGLDHETSVVALMNPYYSESIYGPQADDIAGAQYIYGARVTPAPAPATLALMGLGLMGLAWRRRKSC
jgi:hypothetical protein